MNKINFNFIQNKNNNKTVIILHGFLGSSTNWRTFAKKLSCNIFLLDLRNHGYSFHDDKISYPLMAEDVLNFCQQQNLKEVSIIGHSMGGKVALQCLNTFENKVIINAVVVIDIWAKEYEPRHEKILNSLIQLNLNQKREQIEMELTENLKNKILARFLLKNLTIDKNSSNDKFTWRNNLKILVAKKDFLLQEISLADEIKTPLLLIKGGKSDYVLEKDNQEMKCKFINGKFITIENSGHWVHVDNPNLLLKEIEDFL